MLTVHTFKAQWSDPNHEEDSNPQIELLYRPEDAPLSQKPRYTKISDVVDDGWELFQVLPPSNASPFMVVMTRKW